MPNDGIAGNRRPGRTGLRWKRATRLLHAEGRLSGTPTTRGSIAVSPFVMISAQHCQSA
jgi:hypothetical protein